MVAVEGRWLSVLYVYKRTTEADCGSEKQQKGADAEDQQGSMDEILFFFYLK